MADRSWAGGRRPALVTGLVVADAWWATSLRPFHVAAYVAVGVPVVIVCAVVGRSRTRASMTNPVRASWWPWIAVGLAALVLEAIALALGGRSSGVPTASDAADRLLRWHVLRAVMFATWIAVVAVPLWRRRQAPSL